MRKTPKISVIIPSYNHEQWLLEAIDSVLLQSFQDFELIIIDDASNDQSWELIHRYHDTRIKAFRHETNIGAHETINEACQLASGKYLTILNSDDVYHPERLARLYKTAQMKKADLVFSDISLIDADGQPKEEAEADWLAWFDHLKVVYQQETDLLSALLRGNLAATTSNFFFTRHLFDSLRGFKDYRYVHDYDFLLRAHIQGHHIHYVSDEKLLKYRLHTSNTIREAPLKAIQENMGLLQSSIPMLRAKFAENPYRLECLNAQLQDLYRYTNEEWATVVHHKLLAKEAELFPLINDRDTWIQERDAWLKERDAIIEQQQKQLQNYERLLKQQSIWLQERNRHIAEQQHEISLQEKALIDAKAQLAVRDSWVADRDQWITDRDIWIQERDTYIRHLEEVNQMLLDSRNFKVGNNVLKPLRQMKKILKGAEHVPG